jgi:hypothetical protein
MNLALLVVIAALSLFGGARSADAGGGSPTVTVVEDDAGGGTPTHP